MAAFLSSLIARRRLCESACLLGHAPTSLLSG
jgi:hypothetical protein